MTGRVAEWRWRSLAVCTCLCPDLEKKHTGIKLLHILLINYLKNDRLLINNHSLQCIHFPFTPCVDNSHSFYPFRSSDAHATPRQTDNKPSPADATTSLSCIILGFYWENNPTHHRVPFVCLCVRESLLWTHCPGSKQTHTASFILSLFR